MAILQVNTHQSLTQPIFFFDAIQYLRLQGYKPTITIKDLLPDGSNNDLGENNSNLELINFKPWEPTTFGPHDESDHLEFTINLNYPINKLFNGFVEGPWGDSDVYMNSSYDWIDVPGNMYIALLNMPHLAGNCYMQDLQLVDSEDNSIAVNNPDINFLNSWSYNFAPGGTITPNPAANPPKSIVQGDTIVGFSYLFPQEDVSAYTRLRFTLTKQQWLPERSIGGISLGWFYTLPKNVNMKYSQSYSFDGIKRKNINGRSFHKQNYNGPSYVFARPSTATSSSAYRRDKYEEWYRGYKKSWDCEISFIEDSRMMPDTEGNYYYDDSDTLVYNSIFKYKGLTLELVEKMLGTALPFIFMQNLNYLVEDGFGLCRFDQNSIVIKEVMPKKYNVSFKIVEI